MIQYDVDLQQYNTFGVSVKAKYFVNIETPDQFAKLMEEKIFQNTQDKLFLWWGSNMLLTQNYDGLVIRNAIDTMRIISLDDEKVRVMVGGGVLWHDLVMWAAERGRWGIENLALIPGTVGAAPVQNIGAYGVEVADVIKSVKGFDLQAGGIRALNRIECHFWYRDSAFKQELKGKFFITHITFELTKDGSPQLAYGALSDLQTKSDLTPMDVASAVMAIRESKLPDWTELGTAGSFFRNPVITRETYEELQGEYEDLVWWELEDWYKLSAGQLIELAGFPRGTRVGDVGNYEKHALVLVNHGDGTGAEVWDFAQSIVTGVKEKFWVDLVPEVNVL